MEVLPPPFVMRRTFWAGGAPWTTLARVSEAIRKEQRVSSNDTALIRSKRTGQNIELDLEKSFFITPGF
jgi:hypothetical protein